ncbi:aspartate/glutamate racemase family protein [Paracoccus aerius]|uniref:Aspartate/glutamate racemase family protein n=1 Tax=Paracoccus aerius TaxID=1915382 RepID=A0ABS1S9E5_9RHOB|nr:aspartate/glutamate racemase family protein [Paracoccus aerius]MBL3675350.1 aspartate/glutamate racemase family protein [Paracoccus aerius]GHG32741.1 Asp/Glu/hydantoin racemase [Paracoccus aerius]
MRLLIINPNQTASMTEQAARSARRVALQSTEIILRTGIDAPLSIEGFADEARAVPSMLAQIGTAEADGAQATVIACFDDPGLDAAREVAAGPVIGICQAGVQAAMTLAKRFSIITTLPRSIPAIEDLVDRYGANRHCRRVRAVNLPVLSLESDRSHAYAMLLAEIAKARDEDGAEAVVLGCAGMSDLADRLSEETGVTVIDGVIVAVKLAEALVGAGLKTAKVNSYAFPRIKAESTAKIPQALSDLATANPLGNPNTFFAEPQTEEAKS